MNGSTTFEYENAIGKILFAKSGPFWVTDIDSVSSVDIDIAASQSPLQIGSSLHNQSVAPRSITLDGALFEPLEANRKHLLRVLAPQVPSTLTVYQNGESWFLDVFPEKTPDISPGEGVQYFQTRLYAPYPYWKSVETHTQQLVGLSPLFRFPYVEEGNWKLSEFSDNYYATVENTGNAPVGFKVVFSARATLSNPELQHLNTGEKIKIIRKTMAPGEKLVVSTLDGQKGVTCIDALGNESNGFRYLSTDSHLKMALLPGQNLLRFDAATNRAALSVRIEAPKGVVSGV